MSLLKKIQDKHGVIHELGDNRVNSFETELTGAERNVPYSSAVLNKTNAIEKKIDDHTSNLANPHKVKKEQLGLANVENKSSSQIRSEITKENVTNALGYTPIDERKIGAVNGVASLDSGGRIPASQIPGGFDNIEEYDTLKSFPTTGEEGKIYVTKDTNLTYRWTGTQYVEISPSLALGETSKTAYRGDRGKTAYEHSQITGDATIHHTHTNKALLDSYKQTEADLANAVAKVHDHGNKSVLDSITSAKVEAWDSKAASFDILSTTRGGTGTNAASQEQLTNTLINTLTVDSGTPTDADYYVGQYAGGGTNNTSYKRRTILSLWNYIKGKISSVLKLTASDYAGKAATAGTADKAVADNSGNDIETTYATKSELDAKADADKFVAIADARIDRNGTDGWFNIASKAFNSNGVVLKFQWIVSALGSADNSQNVTFFLNLTIGFSSSGSNPYIGSFETSPIKKDSIGCDFKAIVNGTVGNATIELWAKVGSRYGSVAIRELQAGNFRGTDAKGFLTYASYSHSDAGSSEEPTGNVSKKLTFVYVQEVIASPTNNNLVSMDANGIVKDSGLAKSSVESTIRKAGSAIQGVKLNGASSALTHDSNNVVTIPDAVATGTTGATNGLMTSDDKKKLNGIASGTASPLMDGKASVGNSLKYAREDHVHPSDTSREDIENKTTVVLGTSDSKYPTDKAVAKFVNSSIATNTANYISNNGEPFTSVEQLEAYSGPVTNNDYAFVTGIDSEGNTYYDRYKATVSGSTVTWALEYRLNNSSFTAAQWSAINSGITSVLVAKIHDHSNKDVLDGITSGKVNSWDGKEDAFDVLPTTKGGTGTNAASKSALTSSLINSLSLETSTPVDADYYVAQYRNGGTSNTSFVRRPVSALWEYIKGKISSVLKLTASDYAGKAATAGTADKAVADNSGNDIETTYAKKSELDAKGIVIKEISGENVICFE